MCEANMARTPYQLIVHGNKHPGCVHARRIPCPCVSAIVLPAFPCFLSPVVHNPSTIKHPQRTRPLSRARPKQPAPLLARGTQPGLLTLDPQVTLQRPIRTRHHLLQQKPLLLRPVEQFRLRNRVAVVPVLIVRPEGEDVTAVGPVEGYGGEFWVLASFAGEVRAEEGEEGGAGG